jgi:FkbM family methyltransferase
MLATRLITSIGRVPGLSHAARWYASRYREGSVVTIRHGEAAGLLWRRHHHDVNGYWIGHYEIPLQEALKRELKSGDTFFDIGANAGFFTLIAARLIGKQGRCIAFEPCPDQSMRIRGQIDLNGFPQCQGVTEAISDFEGSAPFSFPATGSSTAHLGESRKGEQEVRVRVMTLDGACVRFGNPDLIKMDIEGAESRVLKAASHTLRTVRPRFLIELHGPECEREVKILLRDASYSFFDLQGRSLDSGNVLPNHFMGRPSERAGI